VRRFGEYCRGEGPIKERPTEDLLFIIMALNHLREWIAPDYNPYGRPPKLRNPKTKAEEFSRRLYCDPNFKIIREICNATKHVKKNGPSHKTTTESVPHQVDTGPHGPKFFITTNSATNHFIDGERVESFVRPVMKLYGEWFKSQAEPAS
jgi:hypothetical protein